MLVSRNMHPRLFDKKDSGLQMFISFINSDCKKHVLGKRNYIFKITVEMNM